MDIVTAVNLGINPFVSNVKKMQAEESQGTNFLFEGFFLPWTTIV